MSDWSFDKQALDRYIEREDPRLAEDDEDAPPLTEVRQRWLEWDGSVETTRQLFEALVERVERGEDSREFECEMCRAKIRRNVSDLGTFANFTCHDCQTHEVACLRCGVTCVIPADEQTAICDACNAADWHDEDLPDERP
jgi:hypothetical protein